MCLPCGSELAPFFRILTRLPADSHVFFDKRMATEVPADSLGDEFKGYVVKITGGNDKQGFPMKQGILTAARVRLLFSAGHSCYRARRTGERKRKSVRGCMVSGELSVLNLVIVKKGDAELPGLTDTDKPSRLGPKRASKIRKLFVRDPFLPPRLRKEARWQPRKERAHGAFAAAGCTFLVDENTHTKNSYPCLKTYVGVENVSSERNCIPPLASPPPTPPFPGPLDACTFGLSPAGHVGLAAPLSGSASSLLIG